MTIDVIIKTIMLTITICYIVGCSGVVTHINKTFYRLIYGRDFKYNGYAIPIISCPRCSVFWMIFLYTICCNINIIYCLFIASVLSYLSILITEYMNDFLLKLIDLFKDGKNNTID